VAVSAVCRCIAPLHEVNEEDRSIRHSLDTAVWQQELGPRNWQDASQAEIRGPLQTSSRPISHEIIRFHDIAIF
jgi:hypothetical protein